MSIYRGRYYAASGCDSSAKPGTNAFMSWFLGAYASKGAVNLGTYACKRLGSGWSIHAERRALDMGTAPYGGVDSAWGWALMNAIRDNSAELGVQLIILGDRIWSCNFPDAGWRPYGGAWHGHGHVELVPRAAKNLTASEIEDLIGGGTTSMIGLRKGDSGQRVKGLQSKLTRAGFPPDGGVDGDYGPATSAAVLKMRRAQGSGADSGDSITGWAATQLDQALADRRAELAAKEALKGAKRATEMAIDAALADLPTRTGLPSHVVLDLPDTITVPVDPAGDDD